MNPLIVATAGAVLVMGIFFLVARFAGGSADYKGRLQQIANSGAARRQDDDAKAAEPPKKKFSLGLGQSQLAARVEKSFGKQTFGRNVQRKLAQADLKLTLFEFMLAKILCVLVAGGLGVYFGRGGVVQMLVFGIPGAVVGFFAPDWFLKFRISKRLKAFNDQLGETVNLLANSLRSGYSLLQSMELVAKESPEPICSEFKRVVREVGLGITAQDALNNLLRRMPSDDLDLMITAINIQYEVGGNLAQILDTLSHTIRERVRIKGEIQVLTAQGRLTGYLIAVLPIVIALAVSVINPGYMNPMWEWPWLVMPICGGVLLVVGFLVIRKIVSIEV